MKTATILIVIFFILGFTHNTGSQPEKGTVTPPYTQVPHSDSSAVFRLKAINDSTSLAMESQDLDQTKQSWWVFQQLSKKLTAYTSRMRQLPYREKVIRDTVLKIIYLEDDRRDIEPPLPIIQPEPQKKKESWFKKLFKSILK